MIARSEKIHSLSERECFSEFFDIFSLFAISDDLESPGLSFHIRESFEESCDIFESCEASYESYFWYSILYSVHLREAKSSIDDFDISSRKGL